MLPTQATGTAAQRGRWQPEAYYLKKCRNDFFKKYTVAKNTTEGQRCPVEQGGAGVDGGKVAAERLAGGHQQERQAGEATV